MVEAGLLHGRADEQLAVRAGNQVDVGGAHDVFDQRLPAQPQQLTLDRPQPGVLDGHLDPREAPGPGGEDDLRTPPLEELTIAAAAADDRIDPTVALDDALHRQSLDDATAHALDGTDQTRRQPARIDLVVSRQP